MTSTEKGPGDNPRQLAVLASIADNMAIVEYDISGQITYVNDHLLKLFGYQQDDLLNKHRSKLFTTEAAASEEFQLAWVDLLKGTARHGEFLHRRANGTALHLRGSCVPVFNAGREVTSVLQVCSDITRAKQQAIDNEC